MLAITRKTGEDVDLVFPDGRVGVVRIVSQRNGRVRLGFDLPTDIAIRREELRPERIDQKAKEEYDS